LVTSTSFQNSLHFFIINCYLNKDNSFIDDIASISRIPLSSECSVHLCNNSLKAQDVIKVPRFLKHINLYIEEHEFKFESHFNDGELQFNGKTIHLKYVRIII